METLNWIISLIVTTSICLESWLDMKGEHGHYDARETRSNLAIAAISLIVNLVVRGAMMGVFHRLSAFAVFDIGSGPLAWFVLFLLMDLLSYLFHFLGHKSRFFWAMHVIHHSSHKFNLTTAIRSPFTNSMLRTGLLAPLVLLGFAPYMVLVTDALILAAAFFQHTAMVGKLGWIEHIINTPSHHRVHHGSNERYIDKNFGGALIIWDRLFGTFQEEDEPPVYGLTKPLRDRRLINILFHEWYDMARDVYRASGIRQWMKYVFGRPGWKASDLRDQRPWSFSCTRQSTLAIALILSCAATSPSQAQTADSLIRRGLTAENNYDNATALNLYMRAIDADGQNAEALWRASRATSNQAGQSRDNVVKAAKAADANALATRAIQLDPSNTQAHFARAIALGMASAAATRPAEKLANARVIRREIQTILSCDSTFAPAYYLLGKWHLELSKLNWAERLTCNVLFGGVPKGVSLDEAIRCFDKAIQLESDFLLFYYGKASALYEAGQYTEVVRILEDALQLPSDHPDDIIRRQDCVRLLHESKHHITKI